MLSLVHGSEVGLWTTYAGSKAVHSGNASSNERDRRIGASVLRARVSRRGLTATLIATGCCLVPAALGGSATARSGSVGSATALLNLAFADARAKGSFHQALSQEVGGVRGSLTDDVALTSGRQTIASSNGARARIEVIGPTAYVTGNPRGLRANFKFTRGQVAVIGRNWVAIPSTNSAFASIAYDVTVPTALAEVAPSGHLTAGPRTTVDGQRVIAISGGAPTAFAGGGSGHAIIYVTASSDPLPVRAAVEVNQANHAKLVLTGTMSDWGERVRVRPPTGAALTATEIRGLVGRLSALAIPGEPGYFAVSGQDGRTAPFGRPWGQACKPVRLAVQPAVPNWIYRQVVAVAVAARRQGIDVTVESRRLTWSHGALFYRGGQSPRTTAEVDVSAAGVTPSTIGNKPPMQLSSSTTADGDKQHDDLSSVAGSFSLPVLRGRAATVRREVRRLIAWTQGIAETTDPISGIAPRGFTDRFTRADVAAMRAMSGCAKPSGNTVIGIAA
jgi:hypothetical protein